MRAEEIDQWLDASRFARERLGFKPDARQVELLRRAPRRCLLNCTRQWGKSTLTAALALHRAHFEPGSLTLVVTPGTRQSAEFVKKASPFLHKLGVRPRGDGVNTASLQLPNGSRIVGLPGSEATVRGFSNVSLLIIDEAARVPEDIYRAVRPMQAVGDGDVWMMSTPWGRRGFFWETWARGGDDWERVVVPATECPRISKRHLDEMRATMGERWFRQEYLCEFGDNEGGLVKQSLLEAMWSDDWAALPFAKFGQILGGR